MGQTILASMFVSSSRTSPLKWTDSCCISVINTSNHNYSEYHVHFQTVVRLNLSIRYKFCVKAGRLVWPVPTRHMHSRNREATPLCSNHIILVTRWRSSISRLIHHSLEMPVAVYRNVVASLSSRPAPPSVIHLFAPTDNTGWCHQVGVHVRLE